MKHVLWVGEFDVLGALRGVEQVLVVSRLLDDLGAGSIDAFPFLPR